MPFIDTSKLKTIERKPGWHGKFFDSANMSFAYYTFEKGSSIHRHNHPHEEVWHIIEGELEITHRRRHHRGLSATRKTGSLELRLHAVLLGRDIAPDGFPVGRLDRRADNAQASFQIGGLCWDDGNDWCCWRDVGNR